MTDKQGTDASEVNVLQMERDNALAQVDEKNKEIEGLHAAMADQQKTLMERDGVILELRCAIAEQNVALGNMQLELYRPQHASLAQEYKAKYQKPKAPNA